MGNIVIDVADGAEKEDRPFYFFVDRRNKIVAHRPNSRQGFGEVFLCKSLLNIATTGNTYAHVMPEVKVAAGININGLLKKNKKVSSQKERILSEKLTTKRLHYFTVLPYFSKAETRMNTGRSDTI
ncbi:hypothetical protein [Desulfosporosinus sp. OT]|uniref:hypothetical protein n=1 Tax=Desulfosporosinus sp. OT TaxID=913865 RepID=UPI001300C537|nr:hypothetical protein [Desulfosporosinus sp. OT]